MDEIFRALSDPSRRLLLDCLHERDGQTVAELDARLPSMTRFGTMKHLRVLEATGLVVTRRSGREKRHYLDPVPIGLIHDRWIHKYLAPWAGALGGLRRALEREGDMSSLRHVYEVYIRTTPEKLWDAITRADFTRHYFCGTLVDSEWRPNSLLRYAYPDGGIAAEGAILEADPPRRLVHTFSATWNPEVTKDRPHRVTWTIKPMGSACQLVVEHSDFEGETATYRSVSGGVGVILNGLKTLLETGEPLVVER